MKCGLDLKDFTEGGKASSVLFWETSIGAILNFDEFPPPFRMCIPVQCFYECPQYAEMDITRLESGKIKMSYRKI